MNGTIKERMKNMNWDQLTAYDVEQEPVAPGAIAGLSAEEENAYYRQRRDEAEAAQWQVLAEYSGVVFKDTVELEPLPTQRAS